VRKDIGRLGQEGREVYKKIEVFRIGRLVRG